MIHLSVGDEIASIDLKIQKKDNNFRKERHDSIMITNVKWMCLTNCAEISGHTIAVVPTLSGPRYLSIIEKLIEIFVYTTGIINIEATPWVLII